MTSDTFLEEADKHFSLIKTERPYLSSSSLTMNVSKSKSILVINSRVDFNIPIKEALGNMYDLYDLTIVDRKEMTILDPASIMLISADLTRKD